MTSLRHPNVVLFMAACTKPPNMCIVMEYMALGSLYEVHDPSGPIAPRCSRRTAVCLFCLYSFPFMFLSHREDGPFCFPSLFGRIIPVCAA
jgi:serine/threonine protein kinase